MSQVGCIFLMQSFGVVPKLKIVLEKPEPYRMVWSVFR